MNSIRKQQSDKNRFNDMYKIIFSIQFILLPFFGFPQNEYSAKLDKYASAYATAYDFHGVILVAKNEKIIYENAFGYANREWAVKNTLDTRFPIASLTKQFTAAAILQLAEKGKLSLEDKLSKFFTDYPKGDSITIHMMLNHTSGIQEFSKNAELLMIRLNDPEISRDSIVNLFKKLPFSFSPGTFWGYSNTGYILLGFIIEQVSGQSYETYINNNLFHKAGMVNSGLFQQDSVISKRAYGYTQTPYRLIAQMVIPLLIGYGDGGLFSTLEDLLKWNNALRSGKIIGEEYINKMYKPNQEDRGAGYGIFIDQFFERKVAFHTGNIPGYSSVMIRYLDDNINIIILANRETNLDFLPKGLAAIMFDKEVVIPYPHTSITLKNKNLKQYIARFETPFPFEVLEKGGKLYLSFGREIELIPESNTKFFISEPDADIQLEYVFNEKNEIIQVFFIEGGVKTEAKVKK